jgi:hypothetical protein
MIAMHGVLEQFHPPDVLAGSLAGMADGATARIVAMRNGETLGEAMTRPMPEQPGQHGFRLTLATGIDAATLLDESFALHAEQHGACVRLALNPLLRAALHLAAGARHVEAALAALSPDAAVPLMQRWSPYATARERLRIPPLLVPLMNARRIFLEDAPAEAAPIFLPVGLRSPDGAALLGRRGTMYVVGGSNDVASLFGIGGAAMAPERSAEWSALFRARRAAMPPTTRYLQLVIPEKITAIPEDFPEPCTTPSPTFAGLEARAEADAALGADYLSCLAPIRAAGGAACYRRADSHLTPFAAHMLAEAIVARLGLSVPPVRDFSVPAADRGDLGLKFLGYPAAETIHLARDLPDAAPHREILRRDAPAGGAHIGRRLLVRNPAAPIPHRLLAFGNSFMEGIEAQTSLSFWLSCWFRECHLVFAPAPDHEIIAREKPFAVICQTIERYLGTLPPR